MSKIDDDYYFISYNPTLSLFTMQSLPDIVFQQIYTFGGVDSATEFRSTCKLAKCILDTTDICLNEKDISKIKIIKNRSRGLTSLLRSRIDTCVVCNDPSLHYVHPLYGLNMHRACARTTQEFRMSSILSTCRMYFVSEEDVEILPHLVERGRKRILEAHVKKLAIDQMGIDELNRRILAREDRSKKIQINRQNAMMLRVDELRSMFDLSIGKCTYHIREEHRDFNMICSMSSCVPGLIGDILEKRVKSVSSISVVCSKLVELSRLLSVLDENNLLVRETVEGRVPFKLCEELKKITSFKQIMNRSREKEHFTKFIPKYGRDLRSLMSKSGPFDEYTRDTIYLKDPLLSSVEDRYNISVYACELDNVEFSEFMFNAFIERNVTSYYFGKLSPFEIARGIRRWNFRLENGHPYVNKFGFDPMF